jgi:hypothetical protein
MRKNSAEVVAVVLWSTSASVGAPWGCGCDTERQQEDPGARDELRRPAWDGSCVRIDRACVRAMRAVQSRSKRLRNA